MGIKKNRVLIVDDDLLILKSLKMILEMEGYDVGTAQTGAEAITKSQLERYDLALLDIKLPDMEGTELLTKIHRTTPTMVKIMVTGFPTQDNTIDAFNRGADTYLVKPVTPQKLLAVLKQKLKERQDVERTS